jgi:hypothetical protein
MKSFSLKKMVCAIDELGMVNVTTSGRAEKEKCSCWNCDII